jgi:hypothetical protein
LIYKWIYLVEIKRKNVIVIENFNILKVDGLHVY